MDVDNLEKLSLWSAAEILQGKLGTALLRVVRSSLCTQWLCGAWGLRETLITWSPRVVLKPYLRAIEQIQKKDAEAGSKESP